MSECVVRMEMPQNCCHCPMIAYADKIKWVDNGRETERAYICLFTKELIDNTKRADDCPIICQLPEGHGRMVDADAMDKRVYNDIPISVFGSVKKMAAVRQIIEDAPTIVPAEAERS